MYALYVLSEGEKLPAVIEWTGKCTVKGSKMILLSNGKSVKWMYSGNKVKVYLPDTIVNTNESVTFSFQFKW